ncbi:UDP-N-acetylmuramate:L-alanyl-gamma-D-glutamyl-meso-diaminopimelate ligase [bacterium]|jgi:UDP-N-acetylmuramate: L-alanyl-gamma-D-glutamyl-meso-diaminopimelate ligase|nr:UDP-N-acetylmuramate:L-alanyl-gamma-D-glutamyl-meso-diaminopimelate ligase [bacterium]
MMQGPALGRFKHVHIIGVCGTLMGAFASFLRREGIRVTGSDQNVYPPMSDVLQQAGVELFSPYGAETLERIGGVPDLVVVGNVISKGNPEMEAFQKRGDAFVSLPEFMETHLLPGTRNLVVAGTHGKTTTSSLLAHVLRTAGKKPSYFIGGVSHSLPHSFHSENGGSYFVLEGDEYDTAFWDKVPKFNHYLPNDVILTSVEFDHADIYADLAAVKQAFAGLVSRIRPGGRLIACIETANVRELLPLAKCPVITYSRNPADGADYLFSNLQTSGEGIEFDVLHSAERLDRVRITLPGEHNALNALAVYIECRELGLGSVEILSGLASFQGIKRRQEERGEVSGVLVIDDFAHHPTAVRETLKALRAKYAGRRLVAVFEPRSATSRRKVFQREYGEAFDLADQVMIAIAFDQSKIPSDQQFSSQELVGDLVCRGKKASFFGSVEEGVKMVAASARPRDVVAVLSNGGFGGFIPKLLEALK